MSADSPTTDELARELAETRRQLALLQPLAHEHQRLQVSTNEKNRLLALVATVSAALAGSDSLRTILQRCVDAMMDDLDTALSCIWTVRDDTPLLDMQASAGVYLHLDGPDRPIALDDSAIGLIARDRRPYITSEVLSDPRIGDRDWVERHGIVSFAGYPLTVENRLVGIMTLFARTPFSRAAQETLAGLSVGIALGIDRARASDALARSLAKIVRMNKTLRQKNAELDEFTYIASHDLQKPLRHLIAFSSILRQDIGAALPERADKDLTFITKAADHMRQLVHSLLTLSRVSNATLKWESVALAECVDQAVASLPNGLPPNHVITGHQSLPIVCGDQSLLTQIYRHLIENALKFNPTPQPTIRFTAERQNNHWSLSVIDNGIGIQPEHRDLVFIPFKRLHTQHEYDGAGIGLSICRKAVERHGGRIWVEPISDQGAHITFSLDIDPPDNDCLTNW